MNLITQPHLLCVEMAPIGSSLKMELKLCAVDETGVLVRRHIFCS